MTVLSPGIENQGYSFGAEKQFKELE